MATLISSDPYLQVRTAKSQKDCHGVGREWRSPSCVGVVNKGEVYVRAVILSEAGRWERDSVSFCAHCALKRFERIRLIGVAA